jgi:hypothetical protein
MKQIIDQRQLVFTISLFKGTLQFIRDVEKQEGITTTKELKKYLKEELLKLK